MESKNNKKSGFELCKTNTEALLSRQSMKFVHAFIIINFHHKEVFKIYKTFTDLLSGKIINPENQELLKLEKLFNNEKFINEAKAYIETNLEEPEFVEDYGIKIEHQISVENIIKIFKYFLEKARINTFVNKEVNFHLTDEDLDISDDNKKCKIINDGDTNYCYYLNGKLFILKKETSEIINEFDSYKNFKPFGIVAKKGKDAYLLDLEGNILDVKGPAQSIKINDNGISVIRNHNGYEGLYDFKTNSMELFYEYECIFYKNNLIHVKKDGKWGNYKRGSYNNYLLEPNFDNLVLLEKTWKDSNSIFHHKHELYGEYFYPKINGKIGLYSKEGILIFPSQYKEIKLIGDGFALVTDKNGEKGIYDLKDKKIILSCEYNEIIYMKGVGFVVDIYGFKGVIGLDGKIIIPIVYFSIYYYEGFGFIIGNNKDKFGFFNLSGKNIYKLEYKFNKFGIVGSGDFIVKRWYGNKIYSKEELNE